MSKTITARVFGTVGQWLDANPTLKEISLDGLTDSEYRYCADYIRKPSAFVRSDDGSAYALLVAWEERLYPGGKVFTEAKPILD